MLQYDVVDCKCVSSLLIYLILKKKKEEEKASFSIFLKTPDLL